MVRGATLGAGRGGKRIGLLTSSASRLNGGVFEAVVKQAHLIRMLGNEPVVFALRDAYSDEDRQRFGKTEVRLCDVRGPKTIGFAPDLIGTLLDSDLHLLHLHGIWMYPSHAARLWAKCTGRPYLISPHGMLDPWIVGKGKAKKWVARIAYERASWGAASAFHALTTREAADISRVSPGAPSLVIANSAPTPIAPRPFPLEPAFVYLGRIHPKKNLEGLIRGWCMQESALEASGATLTIAGWGEDYHVAGLRALLAKAPASVRFVGPVFGGDKQALLEGAHHLVAPSFSEGLPMVILEAWAAGAPVLMTEECNLPEGFAAGAAQDCGYDAAAIGAALVRAAGQDAATWADASASALHLVQTTFSDSAIKARWGLAYDQLLTNPLHFRRRNA